MCGIAGEVSFDGAIVDPVVIQHMIDDIAHRGPDDEGIYCKNNIGLGHRRLSIIDLSPMGHQPMWANDNSMAIVFNGEVYNHREIRLDLEALGYQFTSESDTEVVINSIHCWGIDIALERFIGMFAFAVWDTRDNSLLLVRDRLGVKPLYYQKTEKNLIFGSEPKALYTHPDFQKVFSDKGLGQFFCTGYTLGETTVFRKMNKLLAGHYLKVSQDGNSISKCYWNLNNIERGSFKGTYEQAQNKLIELCDSSFKYRMVSDVPVGVFLSGGIDSTFLSVFLKKRIAVNPEHITIGFDDPVYNEIPKASRVANDLNLKHITKTINASEAQQELFEFVNTWDEPFGDTSGIPTSILCKLSRKQVKVALSADGGDEMFCGYESYKSYEARFRLLKKFPLIVRKAVSNILGFLPYKIIISMVLSLRKGSQWNPQTIARYEKTLDILKINDIRDLTCIMNEKGWTKNTIGKLLNIGDVDIFKNTPIGASFKESGKDDLVDHLMRTDLSSFLGEDILTKVDRASMAASLECRDPFLDHRLVEFAFSLPMDYLYKDGVHKRILKKVLEPFVNSSILNSPKRGFSIPLYDWLRGPWKPLVYEYLSSEKIRDVGILNEIEVKKELDNFYKFNGGRAEKIMLMLNFQMWAERWL